MMTIEEINHPIQKIVDELLVKIAEQPRLRYLFTLPSLVDGYQGEPVLDCQEYTYSIARLREVITYKYLLGAFKSKLLEINLENLYTCISNIRKSPVIDYYDLADYHEYAYYYYKKLGNEKKAHAHLLSCYFDRGRAILSSGNIFDCKELMLVLLKDRQRILSFLLYVIDFFSRDFEDYQDCFTRSQYLLLERSFVLAEKAFAENPACDTNLRSCIYYFESQYYKQTKRPEMAEVAKKECKKLGGNKKCEKFLEKLMVSQVNLHLSDERFLDYMLYVDSLEDEEIYTIDEDGMISLDTDDEYSVWEMDEKVNFMDAFYHPNESDIHFQKIYNQAEKGDEQAIREVVRCYREGDGVSVCECAAQAWEKKLLA